MNFEATHIIFDQAKPELFDETNAPDWLTSEGTVKGSTIDQRWFWTDYVMTLGIGEHIKTDFRIIKRIR